MEDQKTVSQVLLDEYTRSRQEGKSRDQAWMLIRAKARVEKLDDDAITQLLNLARDWEVKEGNAHRTPDDAESTAHDGSSFRKNIQPPALMTTPATQEVSQPTLPPPTGELATRTSTDENEQKDNPRKLLEATAIDPAAPSTNSREKTSPLSLGTTPPPLSDSSAGKLQTQRLIPQDETMELRPTYFGRHSTLLLYFPEQDMPLRITVAPTQEVIIGRSTSSGVMEPDIDLADLGALEAGVSRMHAVLTARNQALLLSDLGSVNYTFVNDVRLHPHESRMLQDGDVMRLGKLKITVRFDHRLHAAKGDAKNE